MGQLSIYMDGMHMLDVTDGIRFAGYSCNNWSGLLVMLHAIDFVYSGNYCFCCRALQWQF